jgi:hypothetical protein
MVALRHASVVILGTVLLAVAACGSRDEPAPAPAPPPPVPTGPAVQAVRQAGGLTWIDALPGNDWPDGTLLRVGEGTAGVALVVGHGADGAVRIRLVGQVDPARPVVAGDALLAVPDEPPPPPPPEVPAAARLQAELDQARGDQAADSQALAAMRDDLVRARRGGERPVAALDAASRSRLSADLARIEAERAYFLLASRVLRLEPGDAKGVTALQDNIRQTLQARSDLKAGGHD